MKKKFVLNKNSFNNFLGLTNDQMNQVKGGLNHHDDDPYHPTCGGCGTEVPGSPDHDFECEEGYRWDSTLGMCVKV
jgi:hypothetical protein